MAVIRVVAVWCLLCGVVSAAPVLIGGGSDPFGDLPGPWGPDAGTQNPALPTTPSTGSPVAPAGQVPSGQIATPITQLPASGAIQVQITGDTADLPIDGGVVPSALGTGTADGLPATLSAFTQFGGGTGNDGGGLSQGYLAAQKSSLSTVTLPSGWSVLGGPSNPMFGGAGSRNLGIDIFGSTVYLGLSTTPWNDTVNGSIPSWASTIFPYMQSAVLAVRATMGLWIGFVLARSCLRSLGRL